MTAKLSFPGEFFDGRSARATAVTVTIGDLLIVENQDGVELWSREVSSFVRRPTSTQIMQLATADQNDDQRLLIDKSRVNPDTWTLLQAYPEDRNRTRMKSTTLLAISGAVVAALLLIVLVLLPMVSDKLAPIVPNMIVDGLGSRVSASLFPEEGDQICATSDANSDLERLAGFLMEASGHPQSPSILVVDLDVANAFAIPGGTIIVSDELLKLSRSPEEFLGVMAHEMAHVELQHPLKLALRVGTSSALIGFLLGDFTGGAFIVAVAQALVSTNYSREFEREADLRAAKILNQFGVSPLALVQFLDRLATDSGPALGLLNTHPSLDDRRQLLLNLSGEIASQRDTIGLVYAKEWVRLKSICN